MVVMVLGVVLASLAGILLFATSRDNVEARQQVNSVRAVYAAESAVAIGVENLRSEMERTLSPDLAQIELDTVAAAKLAYPNSEYDLVSVRYYNAVTNETDTEPPAGVELTTISDGPNAGLQAQQTPIQVFAASRVSNAAASVADAIRVDLIPVFQFAMFFDGDLEFQNPAPMKVAGRVHSNGDLYLSGGNVDILSTTTITGDIFTHSSFSTSSAMTDGGYTFPKGDGTQAKLKKDLAAAGSAARRTYLETTFGNPKTNLRDASMEVSALTVPIRLSGSRVCVNNGDCNTDQGCAKAVGAPSGFCTEKIVSRPEVCGDENKDATFTQSLAVELVKRPKDDYLNNTSTAPYSIGDSTRPNTKTSPYASDFGPRPAMDANSGRNNMAKINVLRRVPHLAAEKGKDDPGAVADRMYWKAHIRIVDGVWYRKGVQEPIFDPERTATAKTAAPDPGDLNHAYARVLRYSWWWDARESRVYCDRAGNLDCTTDGKDHQRGLQIRATDFDGAAFMALLARSDARSQLFPGGTIPKEGVIVYVSETYDPLFEDKSTKLPRAANVRNLLNFPVMHNLGTTDKNALLASVSRADPVPMSVTSPTVPTPLTPYQLGWLPENIWGRNVPNAAFESLTRTSNADVFRSIVNAERSNRNGSSCATPSALGANQRPASRPTNFSAPTVKPSCIAVGATPLGPENAVRAIRMQTLPTEGFTLVTDNRLYIQGDVNVHGGSSVTSGTFTTFQDIPGNVAFIADSVSILSERFDDIARQSNGATVHFDSFFRRPTAYLNATWSGATSPKLPYDEAVITNGNAPNACTHMSSKPYETYVNASLLMGDVPPCLGAGTKTGNSSGGVNNFPRFLEHWGIGGRIPLLINGSMVGLFRSERGNARFVNSMGGDGTGQNITAGRASEAFPDSGDASCIYSPPARNWTFDQKLLEGFENLPPGTPRVVANTRLRWVRR